MNNAPLLNQFDPSIRPYVRDIDLKTAKRLAQRNEKLLDEGVLDGNQTVAQGIYRGFLLTCVKWPGNSFRCWYGNPGIAIDGCFGSTPAQAIERAMAVCGRIGGSTFEPLAPPTPQERKARILCVGRRAPGAQTYQIETA